jgi:DNA polymerase-3 subunit epsilon
MSFFNIFSDPIAFVDLETTGSNYERDRITEVAVITLDNQCVHYFETLLDPQTYLPPSITAITGITPDMLLGKPTFEERAKSIFEELSGKIFVAHNARFDYGFLRAAFKRVGIDFKPKVICTVKLSRILFPSEKRHNLDTLIQTHNLVNANRHRAMGDADVLLQFWRHSINILGHDKVQEAVKTVLSRPTLPPHIDIALVDSIPDTPGVYIFYADQNEYLYIGKSKTLRTRVLSHFQNSLTNRREAKLSQRVTRIDWTSTSGELGALLLESRLIKEHLPSMNIRLRRATQLCAFKLEMNSEGYFVPQLVTQQDLEPGLQDNIYGFFKSRRQAHELLKHIALDQMLCEGTLGLEKIRSGQPCFAFQLKKCLGSCQGLLSAELHNIKLTSALNKYRLYKWPYENAIGVKESNTIHVFSQWCYLGKADNQSDLDGVLENGLPSFDFDIYKIIHKYLKNVSRRDLIHFKKINTPAQGDY